MKKVLYIAGTMVLLLLISGVRNSNSHSAVGSSPTPQPSQIKVISQEAVIPQVSATPIAPTPTATPVQKQVATTPTPVATPKATPTPSPIPSKLAPPLVIVDTPHPTITPIPNATVVKCDPNYKPCVPYVTYDLNCKDIGFEVQVIGVDRYKLDGDKDGFGCESYK